MRVSVAVLLAALLSFADAPAHAQAESFEHFRTRFPLDGAHRRVDCEACHRNGLFKGTPTRCRSCHDGTGYYAATAASRRHIPHVGPYCGSCHRTNRWESARMDHTAVTGRCESCHNGVYAEGKPPVHISSGSDCLDCHRTTTWGRAEYYHSSGAYPGDHRGNLGCSECHAANLSTVIWPSPAYQPDCAGCHASDFEQDEHKKVQSPRQYYTVSELRDCSGSCHVYDDPSLTTIDDRRSREHRARDGDFD